MFANLEDASSEMITKLESFLRGEEAILYSYSPSGFKLASKISETLKLRHSHLPIKTIKAHRINPFISNNFEVGAVGESGNFMADQDFMPQANPILFHSERLLNMRLAYNERLNLQGDHLPISPLNNTAILVDVALDSLGSVMLAIEQLRVENPKRIIVAMPIILEKYLAMIHENCDELIAGQIPLSTENGKNFFANPNF